MGHVEAIGISTEGVLLDTQKAQFAYPEHPFQRFKSAQDLAAMLVDGGPGRISPEGSGAIWAAQWKQNYLRFLGTCGITLPAHEVRL